MKKTFISVPVRTQGCPAGRKTDNSSAASNGPRQAVRQPKLEGIGGLGREVDGRRRGREEQLEAAFDVEVVVERRTCKWINTFDKKQLHTYYLLILRLAKNKSMFFVTCDLGSSKLFNF